MIFHISSLPSVTEVQPQNSGCCWREAGFPSNIKWALAHCFPFRPWEGPHQLVQIYAVSPWGKEQHWQNPLILSNNSNLLFWLQQSNEISLQESWTSNNFYRYSTKWALTRFLHVFPDHGPGGWDRFTSSCWLQSVPMSTRLLLDAQVSDHLPGSLILVMGSNNFHRGTFNHGCTVN